MLTYCPNWETLYCSLVVLWDYFEAIVETCLLYQLLLLLFLIVIIVVNNYQQQKLSSIIINQYCQQSLSTIFITTNISNYVQQSLHIHINIVTIIPLAITCYHKTCCYHNHYCYSYSYYCYYYWLFVLGIVAIMFIIINIIVITTPILADFSHPTGASFWDAYLLATMSSYFIWSHLHVDHMVFLFVLRKQGTWIDSGESGQK